MKKLLWFCSLRGELQAVAAHQELFATVSVDEMNV